jgi:hypothetical protein
VRGSLLRHNPKHIPNPNPNPSDDPPLPGARFKFEALAFGARPLAGLDRGPEMAVYESVVTDPRVVGGRELGVVNGGFGKGDVKGHGVGYEDSFMRPGEARERTRSSLLLEFLDARIRGDRRSSVGETVSSKTGGLW